MRDPTSSGLIKSPDTRLSWACILLVILDLHARPADAQICERLPPYSINTCSDCAANITSVMLTCKLLELKQEIASTEQLLLTIEETVIRNWEPVPLHRHHSLPPRNLTQIQLLKEIYRELQQFLRYLTIIDHNNKREYHSMPHLVARIKNHLCSIMSLLKFERDMFERDLELPSCVVEKKEWNSNSTSRCNDFIIHVFSKGSKSIHRILKDLDNLFVHITSQE